MQLLFGKKIQCWAYSSQYIFSAQLCALALDSTKDKLAVQNLKFSHKAQPHLVYPLKLASIPHPPAEAHGLHPKH